MMRVPVLIQIERAVMIGVNDHAPSRIKALLAADVAVELYCERVPVALLPAVVDDMVSLHRRLPRPDELSDVDAVFIQTGDPTTDNHWRHVSVTAGVKTVLVESHAPEGRQARTFHAGPVTVTIRQLRQPRTLRPAMNWLRDRYAHIRRSAAVHARDTDA